jgi:ankyrin repeat protein
MGGQALEEADEKGRTALHWAASGGHEDTVAFLLKEGAPVNSRTIDGTTPHIVACLGGHLGVVRMLLHHMEAQALHQADDKGRTALHWAATWGHRETVAFLLGQGAQANSRDIWDRTPLMLACGKGCPSVVRILLEHIGDQALEEVDEKGLTALHWAAGGGHEETVAFLLKEAASVNSRTVYGATPYMLACMKGHLGVVRVLLHHMGGALSSLGAQALHQADDTGRTALHWASLGGHGETVAFLLGQGAQANSRDTFGRTPLLYGCEKGHLGAVRVLARHMGEEGLKERYAGAKTVLHWAATEGHEEVVALLVGMGAQANSKDAFSKTPLMWACEKGHRGVVCMLAQHMGEECLKEKDANGRTVLHWAVEKGYHEAVRFLLLAGADPTITDNEGRTPRALAEGEVERAECLAAVEVRVQSPCKRTETADPSLV